MTPTRREFLALLMLLSGTLAAVADDGGEGDSGGGDDGGGDDGGGDDGGGDDSGGDDSGDDAGDDAGDDGDDTNDDGGGRGWRAHDHNAARDALRKGEIIPLSEALGIVGATRRGKVIDVSLTKNLFGAIYTFKLKADSGRVSTLRMNARTGRLIGMFGF